MEYSQNGTKNKRLFVVEGLKNSIITEYKKKTVQRILIDIQKMTRTDDKITLG